LRSLAPAPPRHGTAFAVVDSHRETTLHVAGGIVSELVGVLREECGRALAFIDALLKGDGTW